MLSSTSSLTSSHGSPSAPNITRTYKQASQLFLTRRVPEALQILEPIIHPQPKSSSSASVADNEANGHDTLDASVDGSTYGTDGTASSSDAGLADAASNSASSSSQYPSISRSQSQAPIATASRGARVKVWSLYISMLNSIVEMGVEDGCKAFGTATRWKELAKRVRDASVWDDVVNWGYGRNEAAVDSDVVANLAKLLLAHGPSQRPTQARLETYLASTSGIPSASALASHIEQSSGSAEISRLNGYDHDHGHSNGTHGNKSNGTSTPRDLGSRLKILEIYVLHVLPRNEEWEYAKEFVNMSEVLDEERRETFLNALEVLEEEHNVEGKKQKELEAQRQREREADEERTKREKEAAEQRLREQEAEQQQRKEKNSKSGATPDRSSILGAARGGINEVDYGVDKTRPDRSMKAYSNQANGTATSSSAAAAKGPTSKRAGVPASKKPRAPPSTIYGRASVLLATIHQSLLNLGVNMSRHPVAVLRMVLFLLALVMALARQDVRARISRARDSAWEKIRRTAGMGVKVSYI